MCFRLVLASATSGYLMVSYFSIRVHAKNTKIVFIKRKTICEGENINRKQKAQLSTPPYQFIIVQFQRDYPSHTRIACSCCSWHMAKSLIRNAVGLSIGKQSIKWWSVVCCLVPPWKLPLLLSRAIKSRRKKSGRFHFHFLFRAFSGELEKCSEKKGMLVV